MTNAKSFKEIMEIMKNKYPELVDSLEEMEKVIEEKSKDSLTCLFCGKGDKELWEKVILSFILQLWSLLFYGGLYENFKINTTNNYRMYIFINWFNT